VNVPTRTAFGFLAAVVLVLALVVAGCGGGSDDQAARDKKLDEALEKLDKELEKQGPLVGLGEASPPPSDAAQWETDFSKQLVPLDEFQSGGPPKDGIPAIDAPRYTRASEVDFLEDREPVIELTVEGESRAYPLQILTWHEIVNARFGDTPVAVTFCPLCNTAIAFDRRVDGDALDFGTTGKLRDSDLVMYDRQTESWWQQFGGEALVGELAGKELRQLPARIVSWREFRSMHPSSLVLNRDTGFVRDYGTNPYAGYDDADSPPIFAARNEDDDRLPRKNGSSTSRWGNRRSPCPSPRSSPSARSRSRRTRARCWSGGGQGWPRRSTRERSRRGATWVRRRPCSRASPCPSASRSGLRSRRSGPTSRSSTKRR
jgi:hypothetical protein